MTQLSLGSTVNLLNCMDDLGFAEIRKLLKTQQMHEIRAEFPATSLCSNKVTVTNCKLVTVKLEFS